MTIDQINEFINRGGAAFALTLIAGMLLYIIFRKEFEKSPRTHK